LPQSRWKCLCGSHPPTTANEILALRPRIEQFLRLFDECFVDDGTRHHLRVYVRGQLSNLPRKSVEPIATAADMAPKTLQQFLTLAKWDHLLMRHRLQQRVAARHRSPRVIGVFDETGCPKKGHKTPGVQHQSCGATGKNDNCLVTVHLALAEGPFHCLLDSELFWPEVWSEDRARCRAAGIPEALVHRPKWPIGWELYDIARGNGLTFAWVTFDEDYGGKPGFLRGWIARGQRFLGEVPGSLTGWIERPPVTSRPYRKGGKSRPRQVPRLVSGSPRALNLKDHLLSGPALLAQPWRSYHVKDSDKGPMVWEAKRVTMTFQDENDLPGLSLELVAARDVRDREKVKYFVSNAPPETATDLLLLVGLTRWHGERCFEDGKSELGFDHGEGRSYLGLKRHQTVSAVSFLLLAETRRELGGKKSGMDGVPSSDGGGRVGVGDARSQETGPACSTVDRSGASGERQSA
jgi:SRSO17 transposase